MMLTRMRPLQEMLKLACDKIVSYITKLEEQNVRSKRNHLETEKLQILVIMLQLWSKWVWAAILPGFRSSILYALT